MTVRIRISQTTGNVTLAQHDFTDGAQQRLVDAWKKLGDTNTQAAERALKFMVDALIEETRSRNVTVAIADENTARLAAVNAEEAAANTDMPSPPEP